MIELAAKLFAAGCGNKPFFGLPTWYTYLNGTPNPDGSCDLEITSIYDILKILGAVVEIMLRLGALVAVGFVIFGGIKFIVSQGDPQGIASARDTIINSVIGLIICILATTIVAFVANRF